MQPSVLFFFFVSVFISLVRSTFQKSAEPKIIAYSWVGEIKAPRRPDSPPEAICLSMNPKLTEENLENKKLVPRTCNSVSPKWTTWRATGLVTEYPNKSLSSFMGFIEHVDLGWCITYNVYGTGWDADTSSRGWLTLQNCDELKELVKDRDVETMQLMQDGYYDQFINVIKFSTNHTYLGKILREGHPEDSKLARRIFLTGEQPSLQLGESAVLASMDRNTICGGYGAYARALIAAQKKKDDKFNLPNWSIMASYQPENTCEDELEFTDSFTDEDKDTAECYGEWKWGCGFGTVDMDPEFKLGK